MKWHLNDTKKPLSKCKGKGHLWEIYCSLNIKTNTFQVKNYNFNHTCNKQSKNKEVNEDWTTKKLVLEVRTYPRLIGQEDYDYMIIHSKVSLLDTTIFRSLKVAHEIVDNFEK